MANCKLSPEFEHLAVLFPETTFSTLPCHEGPAADACTLVGYTRQTAWV